MEKLFMYLQANGLTISSCESFTAGLFANEFCQIPGASKYYVGGFICYSDKFKTDIVAIPSEVIKKYGVVSQEVAELMAANCAKKTQSDVAFAFTGYAPITDHPNVGLSYCSIWINKKLYTLQINNRDIKSRKEYQKYAIQEILNFFEKNVQ